MSGWKKLVDAPDVKLFGAHNERNKEPICEQLTLLLADCENDAVNVLEIGCGTGQHAAHFAQQLKSVVGVWQPTDFDQKCVASVDAWCKELANVADAFVLDAAADQWWQTNENIAKQEFDVVYSANCVHYAPFAVAEGLIAGSGALLQAGGRLILYGPFRVDGFLCDSNQRFDANLRAHNAEFGVRSVEELQALADAAGLQKARLIEMPANNFLLIFEKK